MKRVFVLIIALLIIVFEVSSQTSVCLCDSIDSKENDGFRRYETVTENVLIRPECNGQMAEYQLVTKKRLLSGVCFSQPISYPCGCKDKESFLEEEQDFFAKISNLGNENQKEIVVWSRSKRMYFKQTAAQYLTLEKRNCAGNITIEKVLITPSEVSIKVVRYPRKSTE